MARDDAKPMAAGQAPWRASEASPQQIRKVGSQRITNGFRTFIGTWGNELSFGDCRNMRVVIFLCAILSFVLAAAALPTSVPAEAVSVRQAAPQTVKSSHGLKATVAALEAALRRRGVETLVKVDRPGRGGAATLVMFVDPSRGEPHTGYAMDEIEPRLRVLVTEEKGAVSISFDDAQTLARRAGLGLDDATTANRALLAAATEAAAS
jgi:hypothetical protein